MVGNLGWKELSDPPHDPVKKVVFDKKNAVYVRFESRPQLWPGARVDNHPDINATTSQSDEVVEREGRLSAKAQGRMFGDNQDSGMSRHNQP